MISNRGGIKELKIFDNFEIDRKLPKYAQSEDLNNRDDNSFITINDNTATLSGSGVWINSVPSSGDIDRLTFREKLANWISRKPKVKTPVAKITVIEYFTKLSKSFEELVRIGCEIDTLTPPQPVCFPWSLCSDNSVNNCQLDRATVRGGNITCEFLGFTPMPL